MVNGPSVLGACAASKAPLPPVPLVDAPLDVEEAPPTAPLDEEPLDIPRDPPAPPLDEEPLDVVVAALPPAPVDEALLVVLPPHAHTPTLTRTQAALRMETSYHGERAAGSRLRSETRSRGQRGLAGLRGDDPIVFKRGVAQLGTRASSRQGERSWCLESRGPRSEFEELTGAASHGTQEAMTSRARRACVLLIATVLPACGARVVVDGDAATMAVGTASGGNSGGTGMGGSLASSATSGGGDTGAMSSGSGGTSATGSAGGAGGGSGSVVPLAYTLSEYVALPQTLWKGLGHASAIDSTGRLFVSDGQVVYAIKNGVPSIYLSEDDLDATNPAFLHSVKSLDVGPDDRLYILDDFPYNILVSQGPHDVVLHLTVDGGSVAWPDHIGVESPDRVLLVTNSGGLYEVTSRGTKQVYADSSFPGAAGCGATDFEVTQDGYFYFLPGCTVSPLLGGTTDGGGVGVVAKLSDLTQYSTWWFGGVARHPSGGAVANLGDTALYFDKSGSPTNLSMSPNMDTIKSTTSSTPLFVSCGIEIGTSGDIYLISVDRIYRAIPQ